MDGFTELTEEDYLRQLDEQIDGTYLKAYYPRVWTYYLRITKEFRAVCEKQGVSLLQQLQELLRLDAQLQIIKSFFTYKNMFDLFLTEDELLEMTIHDKNCYYRELTGMKKNAPPPVGLIYLSEQ